jgi:hypothetical protein
MDQTLFIPTTSSSRTTGEGGREGGREKGMDVLLTLLLYHQQDEERPGRVPATGGGVCGPLSGQEGGREGGREGGGTCMFSCPSSIHNQQENVYSPKDGSLFRFTEVRLPSLPPSLPPSPRHAAVWQAVEESKREGPENEQCLTLLPLPPSSFLPPVLPPTFLSLIKLWERSKKRTWKEHLLTLPPSLHLTLPPSLPPSLPPAHPSARRPLPSSGRGP